VINLGKLSSSKNLHPDVLKTLSQWERPERPWSGSRSKAAEDVHGPGKVPRHSGHKDPRESTSNEKGCPAAIRPLGSAMGCRPPAQHEPHLLLLWQLRLVVQVHGAGKDLSNSKTDFFIFGFHSSFNRWSVRVNSYWSLRFLTCLRYPFSKKVFIENLLLYNSISVQSN